MKNLTKKQKFIILLVGGSILILGAFIWSMFINLSQISISNPVPEVTLPKELSEIIDEAKNNTQNNTQSTELQEIVEILEQDKNKETEESNKDNDLINTNLNLDFNTKPE